MQGGCWGQCDLVFGWCCRLVLQWVWTSVVVGFVVLELYVLCGMGFVCLVCVVCVPYEHVS